LIGVESVQTSILVGKDFLGTNKQNEKIFYIDFYNNTKKKEFKTSAFAWGTRTLILDSKDRVHYVGKSGKRYLVKMIEHKKVDHLKLQKKAEDLKTAVFHLKDYFKRLTTEPGMPIRDLSRDGLGLFGACSYTDPGGPNPKGCVYLAEKLCRYAGDGVGRLVQLSRSIKRCLHFMKTNTAKIFYKFIRMLFVGKR